MIKSESAKAIDTEYGVHRIQDGTLDELEYLSTIMKVRIDFHSFGRAPQPWRQGFDVCSNLLVTSIQGNFDLDSQGTQHRINYDIQPPEYPNPAIRPPYG